MSVLRAGRGSNDRAPALLMSDTAAPFGRLALRALADRLLRDDADAVEEAIDFFVRETRGLWHGRARALIARRLKHRSLTDAQADRIFDAVARRLQSGELGQQFRDQLRLGIGLRPARMREVAAAASGSGREYVRRFAGWVLGHFPS